MYCGIRALHVCVCAQRRHAALTRLVASVYGVCLVALLVRVQVNLVSRYVHLDKLLNDDDENNNGNSSSSSSSATQAGRRDDIASLLTDDVQTEFFALGKQLCEGGIADLTHELRRATLVAANGYALAV